MKSIINSITNTVISVKMVKMRKKTPQKYNPSRPKLSGEKL